MEAKELRIGNYIQGYLEPPISEWIETTVYLETLRAILKSPETHGYRPIPLTEEWLIRFGFKSMPSKAMTVSFDKNKLQIVLAGNFMYKEGRTYFNSWCINDWQPEYVHQLQNLYFALTGEELTTHKAI